MQSAWDDDTVSKTIQIRDVPDDVHAALRTRAAANHMSLSDYALQIIEEVVGRPTVSEVLRRADRRSRPSELDAQSVLEAVRAAREDA
jgi:plasmid stability protein